MDKQKVMPEHRQKVVRSLVSLAYYQVEELKDTYSITFKQIAKELDMDYDDFMTFRKVKTKTFFCREKTVVFRNFNHEFEMDLKELRSMVNYLSLRLRLLHKQDKILEEWKAL